ncbi:hypothetical protein V6N12_008666 [Hibiscus sabdariffa]|uniref:Uncharacterized protein n=1 Tax=Hibiscus sabdariffa TaxID=183260 RepID=A0ABR2BLC9_9ROSI
MRIFIYVLKTLTCKGDLGCICNNRKWRSDDALAAEEMAVPVVFLCELSWVFSVETREWGNGQLRCTHVVVHGDASCIREVNKVKCM